MNSVVLLHQIRHLYVFSKLFRQLVQNNVAGCMISSLGETGYIGMLKWMVNVRLKLQPLINMVDDRIKFQVDIYPE